MNNVRLKKRRELCLIVQLNRKKRLLERGNDVMLSRYERVGLASSRCRFSSESDVCFLVLFIASILI